MIESEEYKGYSYRIEHDESPMNPREWDNITSMVLHHRRYSLEGGDLYPLCETIEELEANIREDHDVVMAKVVYGYDHSGLWMSINRVYPFDCPWDSGVLGIIYIDRENLKKAYGDGASTPTEDKLRTIIADELSEYAAYVNGEVYGFIVESMNEEDGEEIESCWGYYGYEGYKRAEEDAKAFIDQMANEQRD